MKRAKKIVRISNRLLIFTAVTLILTACLFLFTFHYDRFPLSWFCFECGIIGGFMSIQQRLKKIDDKELEYLGQSWAAILIMPVFGGVFSLVLYVLFLSGIIEGSLFPDFAIPEFPKNNMPTVEDLKCFFLGTYPKSGADFAKLAFWSFVAGFSERFVPQIIHRVSENRQNNGKSN
jgi:hypothetical protein